MHRVAILALASTFALSARAATTATTPKAAPGLVTLSSIDEVKAFCLATRPADRLVFEGDKVRQAKDRAAYEKARTEALGALYVVRVPASGFTLGDWDDDESTFGLPLDKPLRTMFGAVSLAFPSTDALALAVPESEAKAAAASVASGTATLDAYFEPDDSLGAVCSGSAAAGVFTLAAKAVAFELRDGTGKVYGRVETPLADGHRAVLGGYAGSPVAVVGPVTVEGNADARAIARRLETVEEPLKRCYVARLADKPDAGGTVVLGIDVGAEGKVDTVAFSADALHDDVLHACIDTELKALRFSGVPGLPTLFQVPIELKLVPR